MEAMTTQQLKAVVIDLHKQATTEQSHYYVARVLECVLTYLDQPHHLQLTSEERERCAKICDLYECINRKHKDETPTSFPECLQQHAFHLQAEVSKFLAEIIRSGAPVEEALKTVTNRVL